MDAQIKTKEVNISANNHPKLAKLGDYWSKEKTIEIVNLLKEIKMFLQETINI